MQLPYHASFIPGLPTTFRIRVLCAAGSFDVLPKHRLHACPHLQCTRQGRFVVCQQLHCRVAWRLQEDGGQPSVNAVTNCVQLLGSRACALTHRLERADALTKSQVAHNICNELVSAWAIATPGTL